MESQQLILEKWSVLINACKSYYIDSIPTGLTDSEYDLMEQRAAQEDNFFVRDWVFDHYMKGTRSKNFYIEKIKKEKVTGSSMFEAIKAFKSKVGLDKIYCDLKYDGCSIAIYLDSKTGRPRRIVTVGNLNIEDFGVDQTWKLFNFLPKRFPKGIVAIQCEALVDTLRMSTSDPQRARQTASGLINSLYLESEVNNLLTLRAYRYYTDDSTEGIALREMDYRDVLKSFQVVKSKIDGHVLFSPADVWTIEELESMPGFCETDMTATSTGIFLNDGWVLYDEHGKCLGALKYSGAGSGTEVIKTKVQSIQWNNQSKKGKDSWSANVIIDPVDIRGCKVRKPSAGSVSKLVKKGITPGSEVSIILANSTIPMVGDCFGGGNGDYMWPKCSCGYQMSEKDIYGSLLKCGNPFCEDRIGRMKTYLSTLSKIEDIDLNAFLVIDRFKWEETGIDIPMLLGYIVNNDPESYHDYLYGFMKTDLQKRNIELVWQASFKVLSELYANSKGN